jgi:hypothetical protein
LRASLRELWLFAAACSVLACEPQAVHLFSATRPIPDAGSPPRDSDATPAPPPPPAFEQPECRSAECRSCAAAPAACVVAGAQWLCHPWTGECALPCDPASTIAVCPREQRCHPDYGLCVDCVSNSDCSGATGACDTERNACVECTSDASCSAPTPACDTSAQRCVVCTAERHCAAAQVCDRESQSCVQCVVNADCAGQIVGDDQRLVCNPDTHVCVECLSNADCTSDPDKPFCKLSELECDDDLE